MNAGANAQTSTINVDTISTAIVPIGTTTIAVVRTITGVVQTWEFTKTIYPPAPSTTVVLYSTTIDGEQTVWTFTKTFSTLSSHGTIDTSTSIGRTGKADITSPTGTTSPSPSPSPSNISNKAWIVGPAVLGVIGIASIAALLIYKRARRQKTNKREIPGGPQDLEPAQPPSSSRTSTHRSSCDTTKTGISVRSATAADDECASRTACL
ncbi:hypothetical protein BX600DRAFT_433801 [Xylariales sp. PMI_506]|nr:hypothetical protein BX600DRAFT_433801 [Xylariales sp. PMI_506]